MDISKSVALVTGGASGLGLATVNRLVEGGAGVVIADLPSSNGEAVAKELGDRVVFAAADVTDPDQIAQAIETASELGDLRIVVNCAGGGRIGKALGKNGPMPLEDFVWTLNLNLVGTFNVIRLAAQRMAELSEMDGERGVVVNTASVAAYEGQIGQVPYSAAKGGIVSMTLPLAREFGKIKIRVNTIAPGVFRTPLLSGLSGEALASLESQIPHPSRLGEPAEFAALAGHLVENSFINGETIRLDGAIRMGPR